ncbi:hypothetical protein Y032_0060g3120 [Ancylostoma ceylanicum]|uniref:Uncharacterized protein n=1 Tax=Ancylostoma ceylanicum TaxID=53326 RepID=A0A016U493_9BILA|nr:hypothetical protein Y032_0060g3120 [Ancylostoma ceylanicum]
MICDRSTTPSADDNGSHPQEEIDQWSVPPSPSRRNSSNGLAECVFMRKNSRVETCKKITSGLVNIAVSFRVCDGARFSAQAV